MTEHSEQQLIFEWAALQSGAYPELSLLFAVINGARLPWKRDGNGRRYSPEAMRLKAEGLKAGVPDMCLPVARNGWHGLFIELKHGSNKPSEAQAWWMDRLVEQGYMAVCCWEADDAIQTISEYLGI